MTTASFTDKAIVCGASVVGKTHSLEGKKNQDCCIAKKYKTGTVLCVCDGVGSERYSSHGAKAACRAVAKVFRMYYRKKTSKELIGETIEKYYVHYLRKKYRANAGTTCLFCYIYDNSEIVVGQAGDGVILVRLDDRLTVFRTADKSFLNEVNPLSCSHRYNAWTVKNLRFSPEMNGSLDILLASDGLSDDVIPDRFGDFLNHFINLSQNGGSASIKSALENWDAPGSTDDKSAVTFSWRR